MQWSAGAQVAEELIRWDEEGILLQDPVEDDLVLLVPVAEERAHMAARAVESGRAQADGRSNFGRR